MSEQRITQRDIYEIVQRVEDKMDKKFEDHEERIRKNESTRTQLFTIAGVISFVISFLGEEIKRRILG